MDKFYITICDDILFLYLCAIEILLYDFANRTTTQNTLHKFRKDGKCIIFYYY